ncbi:MAG: class I SAM-dependent methyltransferase, partial [bacterium]
MNSAKACAPYIAPLKYNWLTSFYDPLLRWTLREETFKRQLVKQANIAPGHRVLDLGCGTATLTLLIKQLHPQAMVFGLDGDAKALAIARSKIAKAGMEITLVQGLSDAMDFPDASFDRVLSSLVFHHLTSEKKRRTLAEIFRVLKPGGALHVADWGKAQNAVMRGAFFLVQMLDGFATTTENVRGKLPDYFRASGFANVKETKRYMTVYGTLSLYAASRVG